MKKGNKVGICPVCGSDEIDYGISEIVDNQILFPYKCTVCGDEGNEWHKIVYVETRSNIPELISDEDEVIKGSSYSLDEIEDLVSEIMQNHDDEETIRDELVTLIIQLTDLAYKVGQLKK